MYSFIFIMFNYIAFIVDTTININININYLHIAYIIYKYFYIV